MNISEKRRAEEYAKAAGSRIVGGIRVPKAKPRLVAEVSADAKAALATIKRAIAAANEAGYEVRYGRYYTVTQAETTVIASEKFTNALNKDIDAENKAAQKAYDDKCAAVRAGINSVVRQIWNNEVTFQNIDEAIKEATHV